VCHAKGNVQGHVADPIRELEQAMHLLEETAAPKTESWLDQFDSGPVHPYWLSRFNEETCRVFRLGYDGYKEQPCYPIRDAWGDPLGVVHRRLDSDGPKYKYPYGVRTTELLFGVREAVQTEVLFLVEGAMDVVAVREAGFDAVSTYGARLFGPQVALIRALMPRMVVIAYDMDRPGKEGAKEAWRLLDHAGIWTQRGYWDDRWNDLGEMDLPTRSATLTKLLAFRS